MVGVKLPTGLHFGASAATGQLAGTEKELRRGRFLINGREFGSSFSLYVFLGKTPTTSKNL